MAAFSPNCIKSQFTRKFLSLLTICCSSSNHLSIFFYSETVSGRYLRLGYLFTGRRRLSIPHVLGRVGPSIRTFSPLHAHILQSCWISRVSPRQMWVSMLVPLPSLALPCPSLPFLALPCPSLPFPCLSSLAIFFNDWHCTSDLISNQRGEGGIQHAHLFAEAGANPGYAHPRHVRRSNDGTSWGKNPTNRLKRTQIKKRRKKRESRKEGQRKRDRI